MRDIPESKDNRSMSSPDVHSTQSDNLKRILDRLVWGDEPGDKELVAWASAEILKLVEKAEQEARIDELERILQGYLGLHLRRKDGQDARTQVEDRLSELREEK